MVKKNNCLNAKEIGLAIKWAQENDQELLSAMFLSLIGLRFSEIVCLRWDQIDIRKKIIHIQGKYKYNQFPIPGSMINYLLKYRKGSEFVVPTSPYVLRRKETRLANATGLSQLNLRSLYITVRMLNYQAIVSNSLIPIEPTEKLCTIYYLRPYYKYD
ncbi:hypothetical protein [Paenibacillus sp. RC67]|uniref:hypothetical protein n=1 Tax=Paenibacillus sp. RC67 TaxID=3039392 RepID=UPI0024ACF388|nr:hypothetical protein [Paenibacillus sp. RC67]